LQAYELRGAGAVMHSHSLHAVMATMLDPQSSEFKVTHLEMIKVWWGGGMGDQLGKVQDTHCFAYRCTLRQ
jgi:methylthioribulose 1-phosphate dehydratase/enolase-phosphatase E1